MDGSLKQTYPLSPFEDVTGIVLAGGQGKRMGGIDKGLQLFQGKPMIAHVLERLAKQAGTILISANRHIDRYQAYGYPVLPDSMSGFPGPLAGFLAGLQHCRTPYLATVPCDTPFLDEQLVKRLKSALESSKADIAVATTEEDGIQRIQSVFTLMKRHLADHLEVYLKDGGHRLDRWFETLNAVKVPFPEKEAFINLNTMDELMAHSIKIAEE